MTSLFNISGTTILVIVLVIVFLIILATGYVKAPPDTAYIITGMGKKPKILIGRSGIKVPFLQRLDKLTLKQITIDIKTDAFIPTLDFINIKVDAVAKVKVGISEEMIDRAMKNFLNRGIDNIILDLQDSLQGNMREIIGTMDLKSICNNRTAFGNRVQESAAADMTKLGIEIISCNIQNVIDENNLIVDMGMDNTSKIRKDAAIAKAQAERDVEIERAKALKEANDAKVTSDTEIAQRQNELAIRKAELKKTADTKGAEAEAAFAIQQAEQQKTLNTEQTNAEIAKREREIELRQKEVAVKEQALDAEVRKQAEADRYALQQRAEADKFRRQKDAEAKKYEMEQESEAIKARGAAEAEATRMKMLAEAEGIKAKAVAEAEGIEKKAEAMQKYGDAAKLQMIMDKYPDIVKNATEPLSKVDRITMYGDGNGAKLTGDIMKTLNQVNDGLGLDLKSLVIGAFGGKALSDASVHPADDIEQETASEVPVDEATAATASDTGSEDDLK